MVLFTRLVMQDIVLVEYTEAHYSLYLHEVNNPLADENLFEKSRVDYGIYYFPRQIQYIPRNMHTVFALLCFVVVIHWLIFPYPSGLLHWHCGNLTIAPVPATLMNMDKYFMWIHYERLHNHNKAKHNKTVCIFLGIYCRTNQQSSPRHICILKNSTGVTAQWVISNITHWCIE